MRELITGEKRAKFIQFMLKTNTHTNYMCVFNQNPATTQQINTASEY